MKRKRSETQEKKKWKGNLWEIAENFHDGAHDAETSRLKFFTQFRRCEEIEKCICITFSFTEPPQLIYLNDTRTIQPG